MRTVAYRFSLRLDALAVAGPLRAHGFDVAVGEPQSSTRNIVTITAQTWCDVAYADQLITSVVGSAPERVSPPHAPQFPRAS